MGGRSINLLFYHIINDSCFIIYLHLHILMIAATVSFFKEVQTKTIFNIQESHTIYNSDEHYINKRIETENPQWITKICDNIKAANEWIDEQKQNKTFSAVIAIRNLNTL